MWLYEWKHLTLYHAAKPGSLRPCGSGGKTLLIYHVISTDHEIKGSCDFMGNESIKVSQHLAIFGGHRHCGNGDIKFLICHVFYHVFCHVI